VDSDAFPLLALAVRAIVERIPLQSYTVVRAALPVLTRALKQHEAPLEHSHVDPDILVLQVLTTLRTLFDVSSCKSDLADLTSSSLWPTLVALLD